MKLGSAPCFPIGGPPDSQRFGDHRGAFDFVTKPVDMRDLEITIRKTLTHIARLKDLERRRAAAERARANLSRYFSPNLVPLLAERDEPLGPVRRETVAVLFADIVGFTRMAERMAPEAVVTMLREFHERMTAEIFACVGTVEKYIGDAILAVFGLPQASAEDAGNALLCADRMLAALADWNRERESWGEPPLAIGIGLNYGPAVVGDVGSERSLSFAVIGDTVNTASRLEALTRSLKCALVVGNSVVEAVRSAPSPAATALLARLEDKGEQPLRGRSEPVRIWIGPERASAGAAAAG
jgi:adenylate cyclase